MRLSRSKGGFIMFCFQCEQTAAGKGCQGTRGVCGKPADVASLQDRLTGAMIGLSKASLACGTIPSSTYRQLITGLFTTVTNVNFNAETVQEQIDLTHKELARYNDSSNPAYGDYDLDRVWNGDPDIRSLQSLILFGLRGMAAYAYHAMVLDYTDEEVNHYFAEALAAIGSEMSFDELLPLVLKTGEINLKCMALLDRANTETYGNPSPVTVPLTIEKGPFIVVTGHDLKDLHLLLEQTKDKGINVYTHGEMLPAHAYPELKKYPHLKGNFGTAWQNQRKEFDSIPAPVLFTTNCLMPPLPSYNDRVYTTEVVSFPGLKHIGSDKDFTPVVKKALELGGYKEDQKRTGINGGSEVTTGFGHNFVLEHAGEIVDAVKAGKISHFFLIGGCDGAKTGRNYYTDFAAKTPEDSVILTLACGKYRFNDMNLGTVAGFPRIMDCGQCNDTYSAIQIAVGLANAFQCSVNELPLSFVLSWYEQKAVCVLLTLLHLGIKNILLGPSLPAFLSPKVLGFLVEQYNIGPITTPEEDLKKLLG
jgi:hydroxylamine reductase